MADFSFNAAAAFRDDSRQFDAIELSAVPRSRAPSYRSGETSLFRADDDDESLLKHPAPTSYSPIPKQDTVVRVESKTPTVSREQRRRLSGWRFGVTVASWTAFTVMMVNLISLIAIVGKFHSHIQGGVATIFEGSCGTADTWATGLHVVINALSSILLSASNYTMQVLCSPTRGEIDRAHAKGDWVDIGVASVRNIMGRVSKRRIILWWVLGLSSVPVHLLYNSVVFKTIDSNVYDVLVVNEDFLKGEPFSTNVTYVNTNGPYYLYEWNSGNTNPDYTEFRGIQSFFKNNTANSSAVERLENADCMTAYGTQYTTGRQNLLAITSAKGNTTNETLFYFTNTANVDESGPSGNIGLLSYAWVCMDMPQGLSQKDQYDNNESCDIPSARRNATQWTLNGRKIDYCLSQIEPPHCKLDASTTILAVIIAMNGAKAFAMFWTLLRQKEPTLVTVGDSVTSFLEHPDELTKGRCLMAKVDVHQGPLRWKQRGAKAPNTQPLPLTYHAPLRRRYFAAASKKRWAITISLCIAALITAGGLLGAGVSNAASYVGGTAAAFAMGFGKIDSRTLIDCGLPQSGASGLVSSVLLANLPQAICSFIYLTYNGLFTSMLGAAEWSRYFRRKKALRVTTPRGANQRSTYYLQLPYKYSLPLLMTSGTLHWLISESIFLARIDIWQDGQPLPDYSTSQVGYSCLPILLVILLGIAMLIAAIANGFRKLHSQMPVAGSCSVAISAACQRPVGDVDAAFQPVSWGDIKQEDIDIGHCCFTSYDTDDLTIGRVYAGQDIRPVETSGDEDTRDTTRRRHVCK